MYTSINFFVLMNLVYEPRLGYLAAHQIGMSTRIVYIFIILAAYLTSDLLVGTIFHPGREKIDD